LADALDSNPVFAPRDRFALSHGCEQDDGKRTKTTVSTVNMASTGCPLRARA